MPVKKFDSNQDYYRVLGVSETASKREVDRAYRNQARKRHPDGGGTDEEMKSLNEARAVLSDPETRAAYDAQRRPARTARGLNHQPPTEFDPYAASRAGTLKIPVSDPDFAGLLMGAVACFGLGIPLLLLVEMQWMFFLWPLRILALGALTVGVYLSHSALVVKQRKQNKAGRVSSRKLAAIRELLFWLIAVGLLSALLVALYSRG
jgi:curved DNA-binding protein CbpA